jgi:hypothetical protein
MPDYLQDIKKNKEGYLKKGDRMIRKASKDGRRELHVVNRMAVVLEPAQAYLEWAKECPEALPDLTFEDLGEEGRVFLIPETDADPERWLRRNFAAMFENELEAWYYGPGLLAQRPLLQDFKEVLQGAVLLDGAGHGKGTDREGLNY